MIFKSNKEKYFSKKEVIDLMVSLCVTDANAEKTENSTLLLLQRDFQGYGLNTRKTKDTKN